MKTKSFIILICCLVLVFFALGTAGVFWLADKNAQAAGGGERLIGMLITKQPLYETDASDSLLSAGRIYAVLTADDTDDPHYVFEGIDGMRFFIETHTDTDGHSSHGVYSDAEICDVHQSISVTDAGESISLSGTIYVCGREDECILYFNPVYRTPGGEVYAVAGESMSFGSGSAIAGASSTQKLSENYSETVNGAESVVGSSVEITMCVMDETKEIALLQFGSDGELLGRTQYAPGTLPERIETMPGASYIVVESVSADGVSRELFEPDNEFLEAFYCRDDGICIKQQCEIVWTK